MTAPFPRLDDLEAAHAAATTGEWRVPYPLTKLIDGPQTQIASADRAEDAALVVAAVNALPALIARVRELEAQQTAVQALADHPSDSMSVTFIEREADPAAAEVAHRSWCTDGDCDWPEQHEHTAEELAAHGDPR